MKMFQPTHTCVLDKPAYNLKEGQLLEKVKITADTVMSNVDFSLCVNGFGDLYQTETGEHVVLSQKDVRPHQRANS